MSRASAAHVPARSDSPTRRSTVRCSRSTRSRRSSRRHAAWCTRSTASRSRSSGARRSASSASRAAASRCCRARSWVCCPSNVVRHGSIRFEGHEIGHAKGNEMRRYWGTQMAMVFQDPMTSLNPVMQIGKQITESLRFHFDVTQGLRRGDRARAAHVGRHPRGRAPAATSTRTSSPAACASA